MKLTMTYYYSDTSKVGGIKIINKEIKSRDSDWDLFISPLDLIIDDNQLWKVMGVDEL